LPTDDRQAYYNRTFLFNKVEAISSRLIILKKKETTRAYKLPFNPSRAEKITYEKSKKDFIYTFEELMPYGDDEKLDVIIDTWYEFVYNINSIKMKRLEILPYIVAEKLYSDPYFTTKELLKPELRPSKYNLYRTVFLRIVSGTKAPKPLAIRIFVSYRRLKKYSIEHIPFHDFVNLKRF